MPTKTRAKTAAKAAAVKAVRTRKKNFPGGSGDPLGVEAVTKAFRGRKTFSTGDVMKEFDAAVGNATAVTSVLSRRGAIEKVGTASDGTSSWQWVTSK